MCVKNFCSIHFVCAYLLSLPFSSNWARKKELSVVAVFVRCICFVGCLIIYLFGTFSHKFSHTKHIIAHYVIRFLCDIDRFRRTTQQRVNKAFAFKFLSFILVSWIHFFHIPFSWWVICWGCYHSTHFDDVYKWNVLWYS